MSASTQNGVAGAPHGSGKNVAGTTTQSVGYVDQVAPGKRGLHGARPSPRGRPHYAAGPCPQGDPKTAEQLPRDGAEKSFVGKIRRSDPRRRWRTPRKRTRRRRQT